MAIINKRKIKKLWRGLIYKLYANKEKELQEILDIRNAVDEEERKYYWKTPF